MNVVLESGHILLIYGSDPGVIKKYMCIYIYLPRRFPRAVLLFDMLILDRSLTPEKEAPRGLL